MIESLNSAVNSKNGFQSLLCKGLLKRIRMEADSAEALVPTVAGTTPKQWVGSICLAIEGSANKIGVGIVRYDGGGRSCGDGGDFKILSNPRKTFLTKPGTGFLPRETAWHHQNHVAQLVQKALDEANLTMNDVIPFCGQYVVNWGGFNLFARFPALLSQKGLEWVDR